jgi:hypothetical protein
VVATTGAIAAVATAIPAAISELPDSIFAFLTGKTDGDFKALRSAFKEWAHNHLDYTDWRRAWEGFWRLHGPKFGPQPEPDPSRSAENVPTAFNKALDPLLTRAFPRNLRRVIAARGDILAFEDAIRGRGEFHRKYELGGNGADASAQPLSIEVLPPSMCPAGVPAVAVAHTFVQNGDLMYDPEIVFAVGQTEAWLAYEITQHPVGRYRNAYRKDAADSSASLDVAEVRDINGLVSVWARNLSGQGWCKPPNAVDPSTKPIGPNVGTLVESALNAAPKIVHFPPQPSGDPVADLLAEINATALPVKQK